MVVLSAPASSLNEETPDVPKLSFESSGSYGLEGLGLICALGFRDVGFREPRVIRSWFKASRV